MMLKLDGETLQKIHAAGLTESMGRWPAGGGCCSRRGKVSLLGREKQLVKSEVMVGTGIPSSSHRRQGWCGIAQASVA